MTLIWLCRYLCFMFIVMFVAAMSATVQPGSERFVLTVQISVVSLAVVSGAVAMVLRRLFEKDPDRPIFKSKIALGIAMVIAVLGTMLVAG